MSDLAAGPGSSDTKAATLTPRQRAAMTRVISAHHAFVNCFEPSEAVKAELEAAHMEFHAAEEEANV